MILKNKMHIEIFKCSNIAVRQTDFLNKLFWSLCNVHFNLMKVTPQRYYSKSSSIAAMFSVVMAPKYHSK